MRNEIEVWLLENGFHEKPHYRYGCTLDSMNTEYVIFVKGGLVDFYVYGTSNHPLYAGQKHFAGGFEKIETLDDFFFVFKRLILFRALRKVVFCE